MIIGLCGFKGAGKTTAAEYLEKQYRFKRVNFKDGLVAEMKERLPKTLEKFTEVFNEGEVPTWTIDRLFQEKPAIMRVLMQEYGTEVRRGDDENYWVKKWIETVNETKGNIVVDDVRFFNELSALTEKDGVLIRVTREDITSGGDHQSETEQTKFVEDFTINGVAGSVESIYKQIDSIIETIKRD